MIGLGDAHAALLVEILQPSQVAVLGRIINVYV
jgi:hypothetical protein